MTRKPLSRRTRAARRQPTGRRLFLEGLEIRTLAAADLHLLQNPFDSEDVNGDGLVAPIDALAVINRLQNTNQAGTGDSNATGDSSDENAITAGEATTYCDANGDGILSPADVLRVFNRLNSDGDLGAEAEAAKTGTAAPKPPTNSSAAPAPEFRTIDGSGNNKAHTDWGTPGEQYLRTTTAEYSDGISAPAGADRLSPREISNLVSAQEGSKNNNRGLSALVWQWGQFLDHDLDLTLSATPTESFPINIPAGDPQFDPTGTGTKTMSLSRSIYDTETGTSTTNPRQQVNSITAFIDGSQIYGSDDATAKSLRTLSGGKLKVSDGNLLPISESDGVSFVAGDIRVNEQVGLIAMQTLWVREHNRVADRIAQYQPQLTDEQIYQQARQIVIGELQAITYNEFIPALLGKNAVAPYAGYRANVNPEISNLFATASYRFGHSMLSSEYLRLDNNGQVIADGNLALRDAFFNPGEVTENGIDSILKGLATQWSQEVDTQLVDDVRNFLFGPPGAGGFDLAALNIQRGRDHGLADYNQSRVEMGLPAVKSFAEITSDPGMRQALEKAYSSVNNIDPWVGGLAENHLPGSSVGGLVQRVLVDQFTRTRDGDRFWYQRVFSGAMLREIDSTRLSDVIRRNTTITNLQPNAFVVPRPAAATAPASGSNSLPIVVPGANAGSNPSGIPAGNQASGNTSSSGSSTRAPVGAGAPSAGTGATNGANGAGATGSRSGSVPGGNSNSSGQLTGSLTGSAFASAADQLFAQMGGASNGGGRLV